MDLSSIKLQFESVVGYLERVRLVEDTALKAAEVNAFAGSIPVLSVGREVYFFTN
jgi:hypothetical protein